MSKLLAEVAGSCRSSIFLLDVKDRNLPALRPDSTSPSSPWVKPLLRKCCIPNCFATANLSEGSVEYMLELLICPEFLPSMRSLLSLRWLTCLKTPAAQQIELEPTPRSIIMLIDLNLIHEPPISGTTKTHQLRSESIFPPNSSFSSQIILGNSTYYEEQSAVPWILRKLTSTLLVAFVVQRPWILVHIGWNTRHCIGNRLSSWAKLGDILNWLYWGTICCPRGVLFCALLGWESVLIPLIEANPSSSSSRWSGVLLHGRATAPRVILFLLNMSQQVLEQVSNWSSATMRCS